MKVLGLLFLILTVQFVYGQDNKEKAFKKGREAIKLMDEGKVDESIQLLEEAQKLDPDRYDYIYELAFAYYTKKDYQTAIKILEKNRKHKDMVL